MNAAATYRAAALCFVLLILTACDGPQSAMSGGGPEAARTLLLAEIMFWGGGVITVFILALTAIAIWSPPRWKQNLKDERAIIAGGILFPVVTLSALLFYGFIVFSANANIVDDRDPVRITITGEQWWWRVVYEQGDGTTTESANELRLPVGQPVELKLKSADVLHSFWIPAYAGKVDMVPGRTNVLRLVADEAGVVRGQCAEYCGGAHAFMSLYAIAMPPEAYVDWMTHERSVAAPVVDSQGGRLFQASGCGGCHTVRGTQANGVIGPDLTHVASRRSLGAGVLANNHAAFADWIKNHDSIKPDTRMPPFEFLTDAEIDHIASYLAELD
ncbi:cytochrome c oxidase subunit II [Hyphococcus sp.]|uniref:cytochrome c oxidase subunit II n=1 Tax=Hyphococcus sp. TaxID=2038636 RepID=UPI003CCBB1F3